MKLTLVHIDQIPVEWPFFKTNFEFKVNDAFSDTYCDSVTLDVTIDNENYLQVNVSTKWRKSTILQRYKVKIETASNNHYIIMDGDFNIAIDKNFDSMNYKNFLNNTKARSTLIH